MAALTITQFQTFVGPKFQGTYLGKILGISAGNSPFYKKKSSYSSAAGAVGAYGIDLVHFDIVTLAASGTQSYDFTALADAAGITRSWARVKYLYLFLPGLDDNAGISAQTDYITLGGNVSNGHLLFLANVSDKYKVKAGNHVEVADYTATGEVVSGSLKAFDVVNTSSAIATYAIVIAGSLS